MMSFENVSLKMSHTTQTLQRHNILADCERLTQLMYQIRNAFIQSQRRHTFFPIMEYCFIAWLLSDGKPAPQSLNPHGTFIEQKKTENEYL